MSRWQGPEHAYSQARRAYEQAEEHRHEVWKENNPECHKCGEREHEDKMTDMYGSDMHGERWCTHCVSEHSFECEVCGDVYPDEDMTNVDLTFGEYICLDCDKDCAANKTRHHSPVGIGIGQLAHILWTMENIAKDKPYEGKQPGNAKKWLKESIDLIKKVMPEEESIGHHTTTVVVVEETEETTSECIIRAQIEGGINAKD